MNTSADTAKKLGDDIEAENREITAKEGVIRRKEGELTTLNRQEQKAEGELTTLNRQEQDTDSELTVMRSELEGLITKRTQNLAALDTMKRDIESAIKSSGK